MTKTTFSIAEIHPADREDVRRLLEKSWTETYVSELGSEIAGRLVAQLAQDDIAGLMPRTDETVFVARGKRGLQGCAISAARHGITYLWGFYVLKEFQRCGIGSELLKRAVSAHGSANSVELVVLKSSVAASRFYSSMGFQMTADVQFEIAPGINLPAEKMAGSASEIIEQVCLL
ncbi:MAG: GNAT family N-acetyltransferase [Pseudomonadota bacterium]